MLQYESETGEAPARPSSTIPPASGPGPDHLVQAGRANWHLMAGRSRGTLYACPSAPCHGRVPS